MRRADRLFQIVQFLRGGRLVTARMLAERLEVTARTIYRDIADLASTGVPVEGEAGVGYIMRDLAPCLEAPHWRQGPDSRTTRSTLPLSASVST